MNCSKCKDRAVIKLQHGHLCKKHFIDYFETKVFHTINKFELIRRGDKVCVAASGGKDSLTALYLTKKYFQKYNIDLKNLNALIINEGIKDYRDKTLQDLKDFCEEQEINLKILSFKEFYGKDLDQAYPIINKQTGKKPCNICGVWRRQLMNIGARELGATKLVTGHNLDDESQVVLMNMFKANVKISAKLGPMSGIDNHKNFVRRVKPLYLCSEKETRLYALLKKWKVEFTECPYVTESYRAEVREMLNNMEEKYPGTKTGVINSFLDILPMLKDKFRTNQDNTQLTKEPNKCQTCSEPTNKKICNACELKNIIQKNN